MEAKTAVTSLFLLVSDFPSGANWDQVQLLATELSQARRPVVVGVVGSAIKPTADALRATGVNVETMVIRHPFDLRGIRRFRSVLRAAHPDVIHAFGPTAVRLIRWVVTRRGEMNAPRWVASDVAHPGSGWKGWLTTRLLRQADRVIASGWAEGERYRRLGVRSERLTRIHPAAPPPGEAPNRADFCQAIAAPDNATLIFAGGQLDALHGVKDAVTAFDMLRYESPALYLVLTGSGPDRTVAEDYGRALAFDDFRIRFTGERPDLPAVTQHAALVWITRAWGGAHLALRAMAAGKPVVAYHTPELAEVIDDGITGFLVPPGDRAAIAAKSHVLLSDPELAARMGAAGRHRAGERFSPARMVEQHSRVYQEVVYERGA
ncbi:MAG: glycosyltransferase family 4 protein [Gemmataceae bacterium]|nr:glycosyltransferase family 4 protein [Gemmata sp.]MDW8197172.1 glycosyltransferase family 4 protein [Gemmataceae bacterium]